MGRLQIICFANQKGGVGKTTSAVNIAACMARAGRRVLLVDADPQGNATGGLGIRKKGLEANLYDVLMGEKTIAEATVQTAYPRLSVVPSGIDLVGAELELGMTENREFRLRDALKPVRSEYDYILIDCPPALGLITLNILAASDGLVIPLLCEYYSLEGLSQLTATVRRIQAGYNPDLKLVGVQVNMFDGRLNLTVSVLEEIKKFFPGKIFKTPIPRSVRVSEAPSYGMPITAYDPHGKAAAAYGALTVELMERCENG
ncbi:MAG: ParA family protein [Clostridia bacterium]|nr:ParA family protein [Clostridia bacterium]